MNIVYRVFQKTDSEEYNGSFCIRDDRIILDQNIINSLRLEETKGFSSLFKVLFPLASPYILLSVIQSIGLGLKIEIMAEILMGDNKNIGIGHLINNAYNHTFNYIDIYSYALLIVIVYLLIDLFLHILKEKFIKIDK